MDGKIHIMGIVNLTGDSFYAGSRADSTTALDRIQKMRADGADVVDLGACSTRPGSVQPSLEEEWSRLEPVLRQLSGKAEGGSSTSLRDPVRANVPETPSALPLFSIDTYRSEIVRRAYGLIGPFLVNDISAGEMDPEMLETVGRLGLPFVAMHMRGTPETMQQFTRYGDLVEDIKAYFRDFASKAADAGIADWLLDPGFGFSKTLEQNWELLRRLAELHELNRPILVGVSRKSMIYKALGITPEEAMPATQVAQFAALERGARWLRVHDVAEAVRTARLYRALR